MTVLAHGEALSSGQGGVCGSPRPDASRMFTTAPSPFPSPSKRLGPPASVTLNRARQEALEQEAEENKVPAAYINVRDRIGQSVRSRPCTRSPSTPFVPEKSESSSYCAFVLYPAQIPPGSFIEISGEEGVLYFGTVEELTPEHFLRWAASHTMDTLRRDVCSLLK
jgi:hypothetical protein